jgi:hypothetical protein
MTLLHSYYVGFLKPCCNKQLHRAPIESKLSMVQQLVRHTRAQFNGNESLSEQIGFHLFCGGSLELSMQLDWNFLTP